MKNSLGYTQSFYIQLNRIGQQITRDLQQAFHDQKVTVSQWNVLAAIALEKATTPSAISDALNVDGAAVSRHLDTLERKGLLKRVASPEDRRSVSVELSVEGLALVPKLAEIAHTIDKRYCEKLSESDLTRLQHALQQLGGEVTTQQHSAEDWEIS
ncbi:MarR family transcriptional regulator [bacterium]|nr:MarR family transcriptional regulator [bacterium]